jgi:uncharacterized protein YeaO (DUF488 family)
VKGKVQIARVYDPRRPSGGYRVLVDRLWPRGVSKEDAPFDHWSKDVAPSTELRQWYGHDVERFTEFSRRYRKELSTGTAKEAFDALRERGSTQGVTLFTATKDVEHSGAAVLATVLADG